MKAAVVVGPTTSEDPRPLFRRSRDAVRAELLRRGFEVSVHESDGTEEMEVLSGLPLGLSVLLFLGHGGWDGPLFGRGICSKFAQASPNGRFQQQWVRLLPAIWSTVRRGGLVASFACHGAGSTGIELWRDPSSRTRVWTRDVSVWAPVFTFGTRGQNSSGIPEVAMTLLSCALDGTPPVYESAAFAPGGHAILPWNGWMHHARTWQDHWALPAMQAR